MEARFLEFYKDKGGQLSNVGFYYDFDTGSLGSILPYSGFFEGGGENKPIVYNKVNYEDILPDAMVVEGAGTTAANGTYLRDGDLFGKPKYSITATNLILWNTVTTPQWQVYADSFNEIGYSSTEDEATPDLVNTWSAINTTNTPAPTVRRATWADIDAAGIDRSTVSTVSFAPAIGINLDNFYATDGTGNFTSGSLKISDTSNFTGDSNWTFLLTADKKGLNQGVLFDSLSGNKGFKFGFNDSHNFYFESQSGRVFQSELNYPSYNGLFINKNGANFNIGRYNFDKNQFDSESFSMSNVSHGENWYIGGKSGNLDNFSGTIDNFAYFKKRVNTSDLNRYFSGFLIEDSNDLGVLTLTGQYTEQSGYVESGIRYVFTGSKNLSGDFTVLNGPYSFNGSEVFNGNLKIEIPQNFLSGATGSDPSFEITSGVYDGDPLTTDYFFGESGTFILDSGIYSTGLYESETGIVTFPSYTGWQIYSGNDVYDVNFNLTPNPPTSGWENGSTFLNYKTLSGINQNVGTIVDLCGESQTFYKKDYSYGVIQNSLFLEYSGTLTETNQSTGFYTGGNIITRELVTGFQNELFISTGEFDQVTFEYNCLNECGKIEPVFSFKRQTGIVSGFNFIPLTGLVSGVESTSVPSTESTNVTITNIEGANCGEVLNTGYIGQFKFDGIFVNKSVQNKISQVAVSNENLNLNNSAAYNRVGKFYKIPSNILSQSPSIFFNGFFGISGEDYSFVNNGATGSLLNSSGLLDYNAIPNFSVFETSGSFTGASGASFIFTGESNLLHEIITGSDSTILPSGVNTVLQTENIFYRESGSGNFYNTEPFFEKNSFVFLEGKKLLYNTDYLEVSDNRFLKTGIFQTKGSGFGEINTFFNF